MVVGEQYEGPVYALPIVFFLFVFEHEQVELLLQRFVAAVDAQLLERIEFETFDPKISKTPMLAPATDAAFDLPVLFRAGLEES